jgi:hypothetical protein
MLDRAVRMQEATANVTPIPAAKDAPLTTGVNGAVSQEMSAVNQRLFDNTYFRSVDALLLLASYRLATLLEWLPWLTAFVLAALVDGGLTRLVKAKEFLQHDPEMFALYASLGSKPLLDGYRLRATSDAAATIAAVRTTGGRCAGGAGAGVFSPARMMCYCASKPLVAGRHYVDIHIMPMVFGVVGAAYQG